MKAKRVKLPPEAQAILAEKLGTDTLATTVYVALLITLQRYVDEPAPSSPATLRQARLRHQGMVRAARQLLSAMEHSTEDMLEAHKRGTDTSALQDAITARIVQWERLAKFQPKKQKDWRRRRFLFRLIVALDDAGVPRKYGRQSPRVQFLRAALKIADNLDKRPPTDGSLRLIQDVYRDYRQRATWHSPKRWLYEGSL